MSKDINNTHNNAKVSADGIGAVSGAGGIIQPQGLRHGQYTRPSIGYPVEPGQNWHDLTPEQRQQWFRAHESKWKNRINSRMGGNSGMQPSLNFGQS